jgi:hypothetical protein
MKRVLMVLSLLLAAGWLTGVGVAQEPEKKRPESPTLEAERERAERRQQEEIARQRREIVGQRREAELRALADRIANLKQEIEEGKRGGTPEQVRPLVERLGDLERRRAELTREPFERPDQRPRPPGEDEIHRLTEQIEALYRERMERMKGGQGELAEVLNRKLMELARRWADLRFPPETKPAPRPARPEGPPEQVRQIHEAVEHMRQAAERLHAAGLHEPAEQLQQTANRLNQEAEKQMREADPGRELATLREEVRRLRRDVDNLAKQVKDLDDEDDDDGDR